MIMSAKNFCCLGDPSSSRYVCAEQRGPLHGHLCGHGKRGREEGNIFQLQEVTLERDSCVFLIKTKKNVGFTQLLKSCLKFQSQGTMLFVETESHYPTCTPARTHHLWSEAFQPCPQGISNHHWWNLDSATDITAWPTAAYKPPSLGYSFFLPDANRISIRPGRLTVISNTLRVTKFPPNTYAHNAFSVVSNRQTFG